MIHFLYYALMLLLGLFWYRHGQKVLRKGPRDENGNLNKGLLGPIGFLVATVITGFLGFSLLRALVQREISCLGKGCGNQVYTMAEHTGPYWSNLFYLAWMVLALGYALYVTVRIWMRD
ncbi:hypothetical protein SAMN05216359_10952 [Roseateles sp. YR242]|uniref:hypothetical protein n=1 Tax=Roseateles sp. YR242 TaxID=1855305 RepID=UPI0008CFCCA4|nr:hypothetical protein [Roseateles sp. YR242]SEL43503.1 hypothetical protein SAMN05216359_10952 [Roseateles sp. YR242]